MKRVIVILFILFNISLGYSQSTREFWEHDEVIKLEKVIKKGDTVKIQKQIENVLSVFSDSAYVFWMAFNEAVQIDDYHSMIFIENYASKRGIKVISDIGFFNACKNSNIEIISFFLKNGYSLFKSDSDINCLYIIFNEREYSICEWAMQDFKSDINMKYGDLQRTLLHNVVLSKHSVKKVKLLLSFGIDKNIIDSQGLTAFDYVEQYEKNIFKKKKLKKLLK